VLSSPDFSRDVYCLLGVPLDSVDLAGAERRIRAAAAERSPCFLSTPNVNWLVASRSDPALRDSVIQSDLSVADGMPLVWLAGLAGIPIRERVAGAALFDTLRRASGQTLSVYFFGGPDGVADHAHMRARFGRTITRAASGIRHPVSITQKLNEPIWRPTAPLYVETQTNYL